LARSGITHVIFVPGSSGLGLNLPSFLMKHGRVLLQTGAVSLYTVSLPENFGQELASNGQFEDGLTGWDVHGPVSLSNGERPVMAPLGQLAQAVSVSSSQTLIYRATLVCGDRLSNVQLQVNWLGDSGAILGTEIKGHACSGSGTHSFSDQLAVPANAKGAFIYLKHLGGELLTVSSISLKRL
jgi:hypothetical protein